MHSVAPHTKSHIQPCLAHSDRLLLHISVTGGAIDSGTNVRSMPKLHVSRLIKPVDAMPGDLLTLFLVCGDFFDLWFIGCNDLVAAHTELHVRDSRIRTLAHTFMTICTLHPMLQVHLVCERDGLLDMSRIGVNVILSRSQQSWMCSSELPGSYIGRVLHFRLLAARTRNKSRNSTRNNETQPQYGPAPKTQHSERLNHPLR